MLCEHRNPAGIVTKGPMVVRDKDVLADWSARAACSVYISVPCVDEDVWRQLEPGTAPPLQRLRAVRDLVNAGVRAGVLMNPIVPGISTSLFAASSASASSSGCSSYLRGTPGPRCGTASPSRPSGSSCRSM